ncbi:MAG TPA: penicillin-binding transpeptidase domain-containing protein, partial [Puia sp.]|nr:penicillin-binding transpeptidase domain-containing protein [Puia sp.]
AENALLSMMVENECEHGTCIVMETATGKIKAMANLGRQPDGSYWEDLNYAIRASEPGSTFKLATLMSLLEDHEVHLADHLNIEGGTWKIGTRTVHDAERQEISDVTVEQAFEHSSNVGMAKLVVAHYSQHPQQFVDHLKKLKLNQITGIDLAGETSPIIKSPKSRTWSASTLPWMAFGYEVLISPLQTLTLYNAVANNGKMIKPYLVNSVQYAGGLDRENQPVVMVDKICSDETLAELKTCLEGVCVKGTAKTAFKNIFYPVAGKTGTALVANGSRGYADHIYQSSFAGYFPANHPKYTCIVVIKNKPFAKKYLGAAVAGPVFREVADKLMSMEALTPDSSQLASYTDLLKKDSTAFYYAGSTDEIKNIFYTLKIPYADSSRENKWSGVYRQNSQPVIKAKTEEMKKVPDVKGMGLKDALYLLESRDLKVIARGTGKVKQQSISAGTVVSKNQKLILDLN